MELTGKVALITGAGSGIGKATAVLLAQQGGRVAALSHTADEIEQTVAEITNDGKEAIATVADVSQEDQVQRAVQQVVERWGGSILCSPTRASMASGHRLKNSH